MIQKRKIHWGLLSTANINRKVIPPIKNSKRNELLAVASRDENRARVYAQEWNIPRAYGSYEAFLQDPDIDVIYNSLPNSLHAEWTIKALQAGKHVLCEKPIALSLQEVDAMADAALQAGKILAEAFMYRHHPQTSKVKELIQAGLIGELHLIRGAFSFNLLDRPENVRLDPALGGGSLWDIGCYPVSYARHLVGSEPLEAFAWQEINSAGVEIHFVGQLRFPKNVFAQFDSSFRTVFRTHLEIVGSQGSITVTHPFTPGKEETVQLYRDDKVDQYLVHGPELYSGEIENMADAVLTGQPSLISLADSRANTAVLLALLESAKAGKPTLISHT
jgi:xylose dehydrogenase (NAD/NADP)